MEWKSTLPALSLLAAASTLRHRGVWTPWTVFWFAAVFARTSCSRTRQHDHHSNRASSATPAAGPRALTRISLSSSSESAHGRNGPKTACQRAREHEGGTATAGAAHGAREGYLSAPRPPTQRPPSSGRGRAAWAGPCTRPRPSRGGRRRARLRTGACALNTQDQPGHARPAHRGRQPPVPATPSSSPVRDRSPPLPAAAQGFFGPGFFCGSLLSVRRKIAQELTELLAE